MANVARITLYTASGCGLCERALEVVRAVQREVAFELEVVAIDGDAELEARYRESIPVVEIDGASTFRYFVDPDALRARLLARPS